MEIQPYNRLSEYDNISYGSVPVSDNKAEEKKEVSPEEIQTGRGHTVEIWA